MTTEAAKSKTPGDWPTLLKDNARTGGQGQHPARSPERSVWQFRTGSSVRSAPILEDGILYVTSVNGVLHAIDRRYLRMAFCMSRRSTEYCTPSTWSQAHQSGNFRRRVRFIPRLRSPQIESCSDAMTEKCTHWIGMPEASYGNRQRVLRSGLLLSFTVGLSFSEVRTRGFTPLTQGAGGRYGSRNLAEESIPVFMRPRNNSIWDVETAKCIASIPHPGKYCGVRPRTMVSTRRRPSLVTWFSSARKTFGFMQ